MKPHRPPVPTLAIFAKEPRPGTVKTRLARALGDLEAAAVYRQLTLRTLAQAAQARDAGAVGDLELWCTPDADSEYFIDLSLRFRTTRHLQQGDGLGERMACTIADVVARAGTVLLIGTDCPNIDTRYLASAGAALADHDAVLGPAIDGGYVLVGACRPIQFGTARFGTADALADTLAALGSAGIRCAQLPMTWDVDEVADLHRWRESPIAAGSDGR